MPSSRRCPGPTRAPPIYYPAAFFHRLTFEDKFCEAVRLLMALGARTMKVEHVEGWSRDFAATLSATLQRHSGGSGHDSASGSRLTGRKGRDANPLYEAHLDNPATPAVPDGLIWYPHEPTWQEVAHGRLHHDLRDFSLVVRYEDDLQVDGRLATAARRAGFTLGGNFEEKTSTVWRIKGAFGP